MSPPPAPRTAEAAEARGKDRETLARTSALSLSEDFQWFLKEAVGAEISAAASTALSRTAKRRKREHAVHVHAAMLRIQGWVEENFTNSREAVNSQA